MNSALYCKSYSPFEGVSFNQRILTAKIRLSLRKNVAQTTTTVHYDWSLFNNRDIWDKYTITLRNKFEALPETPPPNDEYENFVNADMETVAEYIPTELRAKHRVPWETIKVKKKCDNVKTVSLCNKRNLLIPALRKSRRHKGNLLAHT